jgi:hypothetical protein
MAYLRKWQQQWLQMDPMDRAPYILAGALVLLIGAAALVMGGR